MHAYPLKALERMQMDRKTVFEAACTAFVTTVTAYAASCACETAFPALSSPFVACPAESAALVAAATLAGFAAGWACRSRLRLHVARKPTEAEVAEAARVEREALLAGIRLAPAGEKSLMLAAADKGAVYCSAGDLAASSAFRRPMMARMVEVEIVDGGVARVTPTEELLGLRRDSPELFEMFAGTVELHGAKRGARVTGTSADGVPFWWWHRE